MVMEWIELAEGTDGRMCVFGFYRAVSGYGQVGCALMDWIELAEGTDRWDVWL